MVEVHQVAGVTGRKAQGLQLRRGGLHGAPDLDGAAHGVVGQLVAAHLDVEDVRGVHAHEAVPGLKGDQVAAAGAHGLEHPFELEGKDRVLHRLDDEVEGADLVAADGVLRHVGHENDLRADAAAAQLVGGVHAVHLGHLYVQKDDVMAAGGSRVQELRAVRVLADADALGLLRAEAPDHLPQLGADVLLVVNDGNVKHRDPLSTRTGYAKGAAEGRASRRTATPSCQSRPYPSVRPGEKGPVGGRPS